MKQTPAVKLGQPPVEYCMVDEPCDEPMTFWIPVDGEEKTPAPRWLRALWRVLDSIGGT